MALLLWEAASLLSALHAAATVVFSDEGRTDDVKRLLGQVSARRPGDIAALALTLAMARHVPEAAVRLQGVLRSRPRDVAVAVARVECTPVPPLLKAAQDVSAEYQAHLEDALRLEGPADA